MNPKTQLPVIEQDSVLIPPEMEEPISIINSLISELFDMIDIDDINLARKIWRELNTTLLKSFSLGVFDNSCDNCGANWSVSRRQAINEFTAYRNREALCPECGSNALRLELDLQLAIREAMEREREEQEERKRLVALATSDLDEEPEPDDNAFEQAAYAIQ